MLKSGEKVTTAKVWWTKRRPQILEDFDREIYGRVPKRTPRVNWDVASATGEIVGGVPAITKRLVGHIDSSSYPRVSVDIQASLTTPAESNGRVPVMMEFGLNPALMRRLLARLEARGQKIPPAAPGPTWEERVLAKGWGYAVIIPGVFKRTTGPD